MFKWQGNIEQPTAPRGAGVAGNLGWARRLLANEAGSAIVEMGVSSTILLAMFFGVFQLSMAAYAYHYVSDAAREGARYAIVRGSTSCTNTPNLTNCNASATTIGTHVQYLGYPGIRSSNMSVTTTWLTATTSGGTGTTVTTWATCSSGTCNAPGNMVKVLASYTFPLGIPFVPARSLTVSSTSQMVVAQ
jgi:Flp pilus assembly protein TadG